MGIDGRTVLYPFLQRDLLEKDVWLFQMLTARLVVSLGIWLSPEIYQRYPLLTPYAVRDPTCRGSTSLGMPDDWGAADAEGLIRDDNSLVKGVPDSLVVRAPKGHMYAGKRVEVGFVASHVWRETDSGVLASRRADTYSFVPNLVWLPADVAKLSDREGSFVQTYLQAISRKIYGATPLEAHLQAFVAPIWAALPERDHIPRQGLPELDELNFFEFDSKWLGRRQKRLREVIAALTVVANGDIPSGKVVASRYVPSLARVNAASARRTLDWLNAYASAVVATTA